MNGEIVDGTKHAALDRNEHAVETAWKALDDGLTVEIVWEALNLIELYITLRMMEHVLLTVEYILLEVRTNPLDLIEQEFGHGMEVIGGFFEEGKSRLWQIFNMYHISGKGINVRGHITTDSKKDTGFYGDFIVGPGRISNHPLVPYVTEALTSSYCC